jgi:hypothetical protein
MILSRYRFWRALPIANHRVIIVTLPSLIFLTVPRRLLPLETNFYF